MYESRTFRLGARLGCLAGLLFALTSWSAVVGAEERSADQILQAADAIRNPLGSFSVRLQLTEYRQGRQSANSALIVYARPSPDSGQYRNLVQFVSPARDAGKLMLRNGADLWFYDPSSRATVRISPQQRLLGQASNGDVMTTQLARDYRAEIGGREAIKDGEGVLRDSVRLRLSALREDVSYARVDFWVDAVDDRPLMARYYSAEDRLLKTAYFRRYEAALGRLRPSETVIIDGLDGGWVTVMRSSGHAIREVPDAWLQRDYLPRFRAQ